MITGFKSFDISTFNDFIDFLTKINIPVCITDDYFNNEWYNEYFAVYFKNNDLLNLKITDLFLFSNDLKNNLENTVLKNNAIFQENVFSYHQKKFLLLTATPVLISNKKIKIIITLQEKLEFKFDDNSFYRFSLLFSSLEDAVVLVNKDKKIIYWNNSFERLFGYKGSDILGKKLQENLKIFKELDAETESQISIELMKYHNSFIETTGYKKDKSEFWALISIVALVEDGNDFSQIIYFIRDGSSTKNLELYKKYYQQLLNLIFESCQLIYDSSRWEDNLKNIIEQALFITESDFIAYVDFLTNNLELKIFFESNYFTELKKTKENNLLRLLNELKNQFEISADYEITYDNLQINNVFETLELTEISDLIALPFVKTKKAYGFLIFIKKNNNYNSIALQTIRYIKALFEFSIFLFDKFKLYELLNNHLLSTQEIQTNYYLQSGLLHDFKNILSASVLLLEYIKKEVQTENINEHINNLRDLFEKGNSIIRSLIKDTTKIEKEYTNFNINTLVDEIADFLNKILPSRINLIIEKGEVDDLYADYSQIHQVILNLCINARDAISGKGYIKIKTFCSDICNDEELKDGKYIHLIIEDNGCGIDPENLDKIFNPHFTTKKEEGGTGLGLFVTKNIISEHKGKIRVESEINKGTKFEILLPAYIEKLPVIEKVQKKIESIFLIDDEDILRNLLAELLVLNGFNVVQARNGVETLEILTEKNDFDLIILDYYLGDMNAEEVLTEMKKMKIDSTIIVTSGIVDKMISEKLNLLGVSKIFNKPYDVDTLVNYIKSFT